MNEASKTNRARPIDFRETYFAGRVVDIGCGSDSVVPAAEPFDFEHGDAQRILDFLPSRAFDCVHSSHCLEHMRDVPAALAQWWALVKPGGHMIVVVPDEDLYEQGIWPSVFNSDHKATFRLDRSTSWSPVSYDIRQLAQTLPDCEIIDVRVQDENYDYSLKARGRRAVGALRRQRTAITEWLRSKGLGAGTGRIDRLFRRLEDWAGAPVDQTAGHALAQIQLVARKRPSNGS